MKLEAKSRLLATTSDNIVYGETDPVIEQKKQQIENLKKSQPSRKNRMHVDERQTLNNEKQENLLKRQILDRQTKLMDDKKNKPAEKK